MKRSEVFWKVFEATGHVGAYLLYKDYEVTESETAAQISEEDRFIITLK